jgi:uncharacterized membrane protein
MFALLGLVGLVIPLTGPMVFTALMFLAINEGTRKLTDAWATDEDNLYHYAIKGHLARIFMTGLIMIPFIVVACGILFMFDAGYWSLLPFFLVSLFLAYRVIPLLNARRHKDFSDFSFMPQDETIAPVNRWLSHPKSVKTYKPTTGDPLRTFCLSLVWTIVVALVLFFLAGLFIANHDVTFTWFGHDAQIWLFSEYYAHVYQ